MNINNEQIRNGRIWGTPLWLEYEKLMGHEDLPSSYQRVVDLKKNEDELLNDMTRGHRTAIKQAIRNKVEVKIYDAKNITENIFNKFLEAHKTTDSRKNRDPRCYEILFEFIRRNEAFLVGASCEKQWIAFAYFFMYKGRAFYGAANINNNYRHLKPSHLIQWEAMRYMKKNGVEIYELGDQYENNEATEKEENIARFKRGFGGITTYI